MRDANLHTANQRRGVLLLNEQLLRRDSKP